ncbi:MAG: HAMP domain-containing protein [Anaerolineales bacterium]|nr:HAMP domain-containing protein [Anaerolineales bacterium]
MKKSRSKSADRVRFSLRWKITLPFIFLALVLALGSAFIVNQMLKQTEEFQFLRQLADSGKQATDAIVRTERDLLEVERLIANTEGVAQSAALGDAEDLRARVLPLVINAGVDTAIILNTEAESLLSIRLRSGGSAGDYEVLKGEDFYSEWHIVNQVLAGESDVYGDKHVGMAVINIDGEDEQVFVIGGPLRDNQGAVIGAVLVGSYLDSLVEQLSTEAGANVTIYHLENGDFLGSSLEPSPTDILAISSSQLAETKNVDVEESIVREINVAGASFFEVLTMLQARNGTETLGVLGISLLHSEIQDVLIDNVFLVARYGAIALVLVVVIGLLISNAITRPLVEIAEASVRVASGNLDTQVPTRGNDEIGVLARSFNTLVEGLRRSGYYPDYNSVMVNVMDDQEVSEDSLDSSVPLSGKLAEATILSADLSSFVSIVGSDPQSILDTVNECYAATIPVITKFGGEIASFDGGQMVAYFGVHPQRFPPRESAMRGINAALDMLSFIEKWNGERSVRGLPALEMWVGITTGHVIAGGIGKKSHLQYTVIGDTVQEARGIQEVGRELGVKTLLISETTYNHLASAQRIYKFGRYGKAQLRQSGRTITVYEVINRRAQPVDPQPRKSGNWTAGRDEHG